MLKEKERKKQEEAEMKENKRKEREEMKMRKEDKQRKKAEERARKQEQRAKESTEKKAERAKTAKGKQLATVGAKRGPNTRSTRPSIFPRIDSSSSDQVNDLSGVCMWWLHEQCVDDCIIDINGKERLCFICLNHL